MSLYLVDGQADLAAVLTALVWHGIFTEMAGETLVDPVDDRSNMWES